MIEPYCKEVERRVGGTLTKIEATLEKHGDALSGIKETLAVIVAHEHPCKEYGREIEELKRTKSFLRGGWTVIVLILTSLAALCALILAAIGLWRQLQ